MAAILERGGLVRLVGIFGLVLCCSWGVPSHAGVSLRLVGSADLAGAEVVTHDPATGHIFAAFDAGIAVVELDERTGSPTVLEAVRMTRVFRAGFPFREVSHVEADPLGRGFLLATMISDRIGEYVGAVAVVDTHAREVLGIVRVGHNPDAIKITPDGSMAIVANEGQPGFWRGEFRDPPGSISLLELPGAVEGDGLLEKLLNIRPVHLTLAEALPEGDEVRIHPDRRSRPELDLEPEYIAVLGGRAYVTLQENNAIAVVDLNERRVERIVGLGSIRQRIDASDRDGINISTVIDCMPMPDQIAAFQIDGRGYLITANEGDTRGDYGDAVMGDAIRIRAMHQRGMLSEQAVEELDVSNRGVGRLQVCAFTGDETGDGLIDLAHAFGTRSVSIWDAETLERVGDTGSAFEEMISERWPEMFNANWDGGRVHSPDSRSDNRGPEPEGVVVDRFGERVLAFVSLERPGAIAIVEVSEPASPRVVDIEMSARDGFTAPEGMTIIRGWGPDRKDLLVVGFEQSGSVVVYEIVVGE